MDPRAGTVAGMKIRRALFQIVYAEGHETGWALADSELWQANDTRRTRVNTRTGEKQLQKKFPKLNRL